MTYLPSPSWSSSLLARSEHRWLQLAIVRRVVDGARRRTPRSDAGDQVSSPRTKRAPRAEGDRGRPSAPPPPIDPEVSRGCAIKHPRLMIASGKSTHPAISVPSMLRPPAKAATHNDRPPFESQPVDIVRASVERTFAWLNRCRRLAKDFENLARNALAFLHLASIRLMLRKLCLS